MRLFFRKLTPLALAMGTALGGTLILSGGAATAATPPHDGALVIKEFGCNAFIPPDLFLFSRDKTQLVVTPSGNTKLTCHFDGPPVAETVVQNDVLCGTFLGLTTDSILVYTKSGHGTLTCQLHAS